MKYETLESGGRGHSPGLQWSLSLQCLCYPPVGGRDGLPASACGTQSMGNWEPTMPGLFICLTPGKH